MTEHITAQSLQNQIVVLRDELSASSAKVERIEKKMAERTQEYQESRSRMERSEEKAKEMEERMEDMKENLDKMTSALKASAGGEDAVEGKKPKDISAREILGSSRYLAIAVSLLGSGSPPHQRSLTRR